jgi:hypothetical protein
MLIAMLMVVGAAAAPSVQDLGWMAGCWSFSRGTRTVQEQWMAPAGGTLLGMSRTTNDGKTVAYEWVIIREGASVLEYVAKPSGQAEAVFTSTHVAADEVVFENPHHDFPTRISYRRQAGGLLATVSGVVGGATHNSEFPYRSAPCGR